MKYMLASLLSLWFAQGFAQQADSLYVVTYTLGSLWDVNKNPQDQPYFKGHSAHLSALRKEGAIKLGARYADKGMIVLGAPSMKGAKALIESDSAVIHHLFNADIQKLHLFYEGCLERPK